MYGRTVQFVTLRENNVLYILLFVINKINKISYIYQLAMRVGMPFHDRGWSRGTEY